jgi:hypothetical protein
LKTPLGAAILFALKRMGGYIGLPEVVELELAQVISKAGMDASTRIDEQYALLQILLGQRPGIELPTEATFDATVRARLLELQDVIVRIAFTYEHAKAALRKVIQHLPPSSDKNEEFRDTAIWEAVLELSQTYSVHFITADNDFFQGHNVANGLAAKIKEDIQRAGQSILVHRDLESCLALLKQDMPPFDLQPATQAIDQYMRTDLEAVAASKDFYLGPLIEASIQPYVTEKSGMLALHFSNRYQLTYLSGTPDAPRSAAQMVTSGSCAYDLNSVNISNLQKSREDFTWRDADGAPQTIMNQYVYPEPIVLGTKQIPHKFLRPLPGANNTE